MAGQSTRGPTSQLLTHLVHLLDLVTSPELHLADTRRLQDTPSGLYVRVHLHDLLMPPDRPASIRDKRQERSVGEHVEVPFPDNQQHTPGAARRWQESQA